MQIYISHERETKLRNYAFSSSKSISQVVGTWIDSLNGGTGTYGIPVAIEEKKPMCERPFCKQRSEGRYRIITDGVDEVTQNLCVFHWNQARKEGEVHEA